MRAILSPLLLWVVLLGVGCSTPRPTESETPVDWDRMLFNNSMPPTEIGCAETEESELIFTFETDLALIEVTITDMLSRTIKFHEEHPNVTDDAVLIEILRGANSDLSLEDLDLRIQQRTLWRVSDLLREGRARVFNKSTGSYEASYLAAGFFYWFDPHFAGGGWIFMFSGTETIFLTAQEWIS